MDNNFSESKPNLSRAPQETELGSVPVSQWPSPYKKQVRNLEFQLTSVSRGCVRPPLGPGGPDRLSSLRNNHMTILHSSLHKYILTVHDLHCIPRYISTYT